MSLPDGLVFNARYPYVSLTPEAIQDLRDSFLALD
jgi:hypothetical protein